MYMYYLHVLYIVVIKSNITALCTQGFYAALRLVAVCQLGKDPSLSVVTLLDPPPRLVGVDSTTIAGLAQKKWTIEVRVHVHPFYSMSNKTEHLNTSNLPSTLPFTLPYLYI